MMIKYKESKILDKHVMVFDCTKNDVSELESAIKTKWNNMKWDIVVGNPPYGMGRSIIHLRIMKSVIPFCNNNINFIMPSKPITQQLEENWYNMFKDAVCNRIEVVPKEVFKDTNMEETAIYYCDRNDKHENYCKKLDVDNIIYNAIKDEGRLFIDKMNIACKKHLVYKFFIDGHYDKCFKKIQTGISDDKYYLNVNYAGVKPGKGFPQWLTSNLQEKDILSGNEEIEYCKNNTEVKAIIECPNKEYGENLKYLMTNGKVLMYSLWLTQISQNINVKQYKYVPDIDYTNIYNDEELLSTCGFTEEETKKILEYLNDFDFTQNRNDVVRNYTGEEVDTDETESETPKTRMDILKENTELKLRVKPSLLFLNW